MPNKQELFYQYKQQYPQQLFPPEGDKSNFPFWAKVWPSAIALSKYLVEHKKWIADKKVLELAAGLGLPGLVASRFAKNCMITDYVADALTYVEASIQKNKINNCTTKQLDWNQIGETVTCDVLLMSDVNYEPAAFAGLEKLFGYFLQQNTTILLATPQRLMAKPFVEKILPFCTQNNEYEIDLYQQKEFINVMKLQYV